MPKNPYTLYVPELQTSHVVFASPHSGRDYPLDFLEKSLLDDQLIRSSEDAFVDLLFDQVVEFGSPLLAAKAPRAYLDLNRASEELDPAIIEGVRRAGHNPRVNSGLGVIPRVVANGRAIYRGKITLEEARQRIATNWHPYHIALQKMITDTRRDFGQCVLIDCHSMPHEAITSTTPNGEKPAEIVLGDRFGAAADQNVIERIEAAFVAQGFNVVRNAPFAGAFTTQKYGRPTRGQHVVQVEIDRSLYMNETQIRPNSNFGAFRKQLRNVVEEITNGSVTDLGLAAE